MDDYTGVTNMIPCFDAIRLIETLRGDALVVSTCTPSQYWQDVSSREDLDISLPGTMGKASSLALGLALATPEKKIIVLDGDGSILMNLGSLITVSGSQSRNFIHFVFEDREYYTTGSQPIPGAGISNIAEIGNSSGYKSTKEYKDIEIFKNDLPEILASTGPVLVTLLVNHPDKVPPFKINPKKTLLHMKEALTNQ